LLDLSASSHADTCATCGATWQRMRTQARALGTLRRHAVPVELEGRIVATLHAGYREDRAVRHLRALPPVDAPAELERRIADILTPQRAPAVLERLVAEDQGDPARALARRFTRKLGRRRAPADLDERMLRGIDANTTPSFTWRKVLSIAAGIFLTAWVGVAAGRQLTPEPRRYDFEVREMASADELSPFARQMIGGFLGGALEARAQ